MLNTQEFIDGFREAAALVGPADGGGWEAEWTPEAMATMEIDCLNFVAVNLVMLNDAVTTGGYTSWEAGHDFFLTRNRHPEGYEDRGLGKIGNVLCSAAYAEGPAWILPTTDGRWEYLSS